MKFRHQKYTWSRPFLTIQHRWEMVGPNGAIHFTASVYEKEDNATCGLEFHHHSGEGAPHHLNCPLTGGRCWHDGTSLHATENLWPLIKGYLSDGSHDIVFSLLEREYESHFEPNEESTS